MGIILVLCGLAVGGIITYLTIRPRLLDKKQKDSITEIYNQGLEKTRIALEKQIDEAQEVFDGLIKYCETIKQDIHIREVEKKHLEEIISLTEQNASKNAELIKEKAMSEMSDSLSAAADKKAEEYRKAEENYQQHYEQTLKELTKEFTEDFNTKQNRIAVAQATLDDLERKVKNAVAANIREEEKKNKTSFYTLGISELDIQEVNKIRSILPYLRNGRPLNKAIWECYYRNAANDLASRVIGAGTHTGIYRITCLLDNKTYIGQARDLRDRWIQHIKCGLGIDTTNAKLYTAMLESGVENFSFEVVEECAAADLNKQEKYWIEYYQSNIYGYNMSSGGARS